MEGEIDKDELKAAGAEVLPAGRSGLRIHGWEIETRKFPILNSLNVQHKPFQQVILDYDYTFTTPYCGGETVEKNSEQQDTIYDDGSYTLHWEDCEERIDLTALASKEPILFYDEVIFYEDELADSGVSLLTVKVRVMPSCWFLLLRFWLRVDGVLMRLRDTRIHCSFSDSKKPVILRECCWREATFEALSSKGYPSDCAAYVDPSTICHRLPVILHKTQKLMLSD